jgi:transposase
MGGAVRLRQDFGADELRRFAVKAKDGAQARRLLALAAVHDGMKRCEAARIGGMDRQTLRDWVHRFNQYGPEGLIDIKPPGRPSKLSEDQKEALKQLVETGPDPATDGVVRWRRRSQLLKKLSNAGRAGREHARPGTPIEVWFQDEMRVGQKNSLVYQWARKGSRPRQPKDQRYENAYLFGAVCPSRDTGVALIMPQADTEAMQAHLEAIGRAVAPSAHALLILDKAGWHTTRKLNPPSNLTLVPLPPACPELNAAENIWQYLRQTYLANRVFADYTAILDACQDAWRKLLAETGRVTSIAQRDWITIGQSH